MHVSLDGFVANANGELDWIKVDEQIFGYAGKVTDQADVALYGRVTYEMMEGYWPTAADQPNATAHDVQHGHWYNGVKKVIVSNSLQGQDLPNTQIIGGSNLAAEIRDLKQQPGKDIAMFGSPTTAHSLMEQDLSDADGTNRH